MQPEPEAVTVADASAVLVAPQYDFGPRIIHVPQPGERRDRASVPDEYHLDHDGDEYVPPRRRAAPKPQTRNDMPAEPRRKPFNPSPPPRQHRTVLNAPPGDTSLTPIRPTPRFDARPQSGDKFPAVPPPGYAPPRTLPQPVPSEGTDSTDSE
jgi:hypothetical protein